MIKNFSNEIGERGEKIFELSITSFTDAQPPLFRAVFLGAKWEGIDFLVETVGGQHRKNFFFVQVKSTTAQPNKRGISVSIKRKEVDKLRRIPAPTYLAGVDVKSEKVYLGYVSSRTKKPSRISLKNELTLSRLKDLHNEVSEFWKKMPRNQIKSKFTV